MHYLRIFSTSKLCILFIFIFGLNTFFTEKEWGKKPISNDVILYYAYLPAIYIYQDVRLGYQADSSFPKSVGVWDRTPDNKIIIKMTMGLSYLYTPFFLIGHLYAKLFHLPTDGYSQPYLISVLLGAFLLLLTGFIFLRKILIEFFTDNVVACILASIYFGTNLLWYSTREALMAHSFLFSIMCIYLFCIYKWYKKPGVKYSWITGLLIGIMVVIRPTMIIASLPFLLYKVESFSAFKQNVKFLVKNWNYLLLMGGMIILPIIPQMMYWHTVTGHWIYYSYAAEHFYFNHPHIFEGLFSFRKGWFLYTPLMLLAVIGIFLPNKKTKLFSLSAFLTISLCIYVVYSWWTWWFGGSFGSRPMIEYYAVLAIPLGNFYEWAEKRRNYFRSFLFLIVAFFVYLNLFQTWQYKTGLLHYDSMTSKAYFTHFLKSEVNVRHYTELRHPDYKRALNGLPFEFAPTQQGREYFKIQDFEVPDPGNIHLTQEIKKGGSFSCKISDSDTLVNILTFEAVDLMQYAPDTIFFSADVFAREAILEGELTFTYKLKNDSSVYEEKNIHIHIDGNKTNSWNTISFAFPFRTNGDRTNVIFGIRQKSVKTMYVDNVFVEFNQLQGIEPE